MTIRVAILLGVLLLAGLAWARLAVNQNATLAQLLAEIDGRNVTVRALRLAKSVCNLAASVAGVPGDVLAYRVTFDRCRPPVFDVEIADDVLAGEFRFQAVIP